MPQLPPPAVASLAVSGVMLLVWVFFFTKTSLRTSAFTLAQNGTLQCIDRKETSRSMIGDVLLSVPTVRNNAFHGGKFPDAIITDPLRDEQLIRDCLAVLEALLKLPPPKGVAENFKP